MYLRVLCNFSIFDLADIYVSSAQVRIFPYLIGRESAFADNLKWMACANKGSGFPFLFLNVPQDRFLK